MLLAMERYTYIPCPSKTLKKTGCEPLLKVYIYMDIYIYTGWGPLVISWFITPSKYNYKILLVSYTIGIIVINQLS